MATLVGSLLGACLEPPMAAESDLKTQVAAEPLYYESAGVWPQTDIHLCWENTAHSTPEHRQWVRMIIESEFEDISDINFYGWGGCNGEAREVVIRVGENEWPRALIGQRSPSTAPNIWLNFFTTTARDLNNQDGDGNPATGVDFGACYGTSPYTGYTGRSWSSYRRWCIETTAVHEFAHLLAIAHEQNRSDTPASCTGANDGWGDSEFGYWDITSVSNYCNPAWGNDARLSVLDVSWLQDTYGTSTNDHLYWGIGDVRDYAFGTTPQLAFHVREADIASGVIPLVGDFDGDTYEDIFWYGRGAIADSIWFFNDNGSYNVRTESVSGTYEPFVGDFNGDGYADIFWYRPGTGTDAIWFFNWDKTHVSHSEEVNGTYTPMAGDFNGDGVSDVFWYRPGTQSDPIWFFDEDKTHTSVNESVDPTYVPFAGDFDGDQISDIFWYRPGTSSDAVWYFAANGSHTSTSITVNGTYSPVVGDFDGSGTDDVWWFTPGTGDEDDSLWSMSTTNGEYESSSIHYGGAGVGVSGDMNGDGVDDIFFYGQ